jgi:hypothetical protein
MEEQKNQLDKTVSQQDTTPKVTGMGGFSFSLKTQKRQKNGIQKI